MYAPQKADIVADLTDKTTNALGLTAKSIGKTQARKEFFPLVDSLDSANSAVKITDHDEPVAVLISYQNYVALTAKAASRLAPASGNLPNLLGSITVTADLDAASDEIKTNFETAIAESADTL